MASGPQPAAATARRGGGLGLIDGLKGKPAVFVVPADGLTLEKAAERFRQLKADYPDYEAEFTQGRPLPAAAATEVRSRARANYQRLLEPARVLILQKLHESALRRSRGAGSGNASAMAASARMAQGAGGVGRLARPRLDAGAPRRSRRP